MSGTMDDADTFFRDAAEIEDVNEKLGAANPAR
jgi:hypothetical protein